MKKIMFSFSLCLCVGFSAMAQDVDEEFNAAYSTKRGVYLLPQAGDFALGIDATPFLRYLGNIFTSSFNPAPSFNGVDQTLYGKYFLQDNRAIRARLTINIDNNVYKGVVPDDAAILQAGTTPDPDLYTKLTDVERSTASRVELGVGYEFRRGNGRVQGFYGGEVFLGFEGGKTKYEYANKITTDNQNPSRSIGYSGNINGTDSRITEDKIGNALYAGLGAFAGVEYFFAPQISIGGEFGFGFIFNTEAQGQSTWEGWDATEVKTQTRKSDAWGHSIQVNTRPAGSIFLMFHF